MKVATVNVHGWLDGYDGINVDGLGCKLRQIGPDILVLQEVSMLLNSSYVEQLFNTVGLEYNSVVDQQNIPRDLNGALLLGRDIHLVVRWCILPVVEDKELLDVL